MQTETYIRRPFEVSAVQVTPSNAEEVAEWCGGKVGEASYKVMGQKVKLAAVMVPGNGKNNGTLLEAKIGMWVVGMNNRFRVYRDHEFRADFAKKHGMLREDFKPGDLVEVIDQADPMYGWQGEVELVNQTCITMPGAGGYLCEAKDLKKIDEYSDETMERIKEEARLAAMKPTLDSNEVLEKLNAIRAAAEAGMEVGIPVQGSVDAQEPTEPVTEIHGIKTGYVVRVKLEANAFFGETGSVVGLGKDGVRILVVLHENATGDLLEPIPFQWDELDVIALSLEETPVDDFEQDQMVELRESQQIDGQLLPAGTTARVTVVGIDMPGMDEFGIEVLFADGRYGQFLARDLKKI